MMPLQFRVRNGGARSDNERQQEQQRAIVAVSRGRGVGSKNELISSANFISLGICGQEKG